MIDFLCKQNEWTIYLVIFSVLVDIYAARMVEKSVENKGLYLVLITTVVINVLANLIYYSVGSLFNITPISSMIMIVLLCKVLVEMYDSDKEKTRSILYHIAKTKQGSKKEVCDQHHEKILEQNLNGACKDCPLLERI